MPWFYLLLAGLLEIVWAFAMKQSQGFSRFWPAAVTRAAFAMGVATMITRTASGIGGK